MLFNVLFKVIVLLLFLELFKYNFFKVFDWFNSLIKISFRLNW